MDTVFCILLLFLPLSCMGEEIPSIIFSKSGEDDVIYDDHHLVSLAISSRLECGFRCWRTEDCLAFTFTGGLSSGTCRLHSQAITSQCPRTSLKAPGSVTYRQIQGPEISALCNKPDCAACIGFECFFGQCLCKPGYYYSVGSQICVETCNETDLLQDFVKYAVSGIGGYNMEAYGSITLEECMARCVSNTACLTFEYYKEDGTCNLQPVTALDVGWKRGNDFGWDLYQRMCA